MRSQDQLFLYEEVMLLALRDAEGTIASNMYQYALGGAVLAELLLAGRVAVEDSKKKLVNVISSEPVGDLFLDQCFERISSAKRRGSIQSWVSRFANTRGLNHLIAQQLCSRGILRANEQEFLWIFTRRVYPEINHEPERRLIERLREAIFGDASDIDARTVVMVSLANSAGLLNIVFNKKELKKRKSRIEQIVNGEVTGKAASQAIEAMQAAVMVAVIMPMIMTAAINH